MLISILRSFSPLVLPNHFPRGRQSSPVSPPCLPLGGGEWSAENGFATRVDRQKNFFCYATHFGLPCAVTPKERDISATKENMIIVTLIRLLVNVIISPCNYMHHVPPHSVLDCPNSCLAIRDLDKFHLLIMFQYFSL